MDIKEIENLHERLAKEFMEKTECYELSTVLFDLLLNCEKYIVLAKENNPCKICFAVKEKYGDNPRVTPEDTGKVLDPVSSKAVIHSSMGKISFGRLEKEEYNNDFIILNGRISHE